MMTPRRLPNDVRKLCELLAAPPRLVAHLTLVHDVAADLVNALAEAFPRLDVERDAVLLGAATHDLGKVLHPNELTEPGHLHEEEGLLLLERLGVPTHVARFARTHARWEDQPLEDVLVALADALWKGNRAEALEARATKLVAERTEFEAWSVFSILDATFERIAAHGDERLAWQLPSRRSCG